MNELETILEGPVLLAWNHFTPLTKTPWAGEKIYEQLKKHLPNVTEKRIGESWEFSCDPSFETPLLYPNAFFKTIQNLISADPEGCLSPFYTSTYHNQFIGCDVLVKLLNAREPLSFQVHPEDQDINLLPNECGKPESWLVLEALEGAGLYLGFSKFISKEELAKKLDQKEDLSPYLQFVPVKAGDYFEIAPGVIHAVGPNVILLEPQRVYPGKSGKTYRFWDWGRKYNAKGERDDVNGQERPLHLKESLKLIEPEKQTGKEFVDLLRRKASLLKTGQTEIQIFPKNPYYQVFYIKVKEQDSFTVQIENGFGVLTIFEGELNVSGKNLQPNKMLKGQSAFLPHKGFPFLISSLCQDEVVLTLVVPSVAEVFFRS